MTIDAPTGVSGANGQASARRLFECWPALLGLLVLGVPTAIRLGEQVWSTEAGAHGPIVLVTGLWLIRHIVRQENVGITPPNWLIVAAIAVPGLAAYVFGRAYDFISIETGGLYLIGLSVAYRLVGGAAMRILAFPFFYLAFLVPPPGWVIDSLTAPLQQAISLTATEVLQVFGYPIVRSGVALFIAQYQLLVEEACSGMNSIVGLTAISLFYIYLMHRASLRYALLLVALLLPIAVIANLVRVILLVLITYHFGDAAAQGFLHVTAGLVLFAVALLLIFAIDSLLQRMLGRRRAA